jgi:hypothetical protein
MCMSRVSTPARSGGCPPPPPLPTPPAPSPPCPKTTAQHSSMLAVDRASGRPEQAQWDGRPGEEEKGGGGGHDGARRGAHVLGAVGATVCRGATGATVCTDVGQRFSLDANDRNPSPHRHVSALIATPYRCGTAAAPQLLGRSREAREDGGGPLGSGGGRHAQRRALPRVVCVCLPCRLARTTRCLWVGCHRPSIRAMREQGLAMNIFQVIQFFSAFGI